MKKINQLILGFLLASACFVTSVNADVPSNYNQAKNLKIGVVNFKVCVEHSKLGKQEQGNFEALKKKMELTLEEKEKHLNELANKLSDNDYLDSLSAEAETELKRNFRQQSQELNLQQNQFYQSLSQTNVKVIQRVTELVTNAANEIAKNEGFDLILSEEAAFYYAPTLDISDKVVALLDRDFDRDNKDSTAPAGIPKL